MAKEYWIYKPRRTVVINGFTVQRDMLCIFYGREMVLVYRPQYWGNSTQAGKLWKRTLSGWVSYYADIDDFQELENYGVNTVPLWNAYEAEKYYSCY